MIRKFIPLIILLFFLLGGWEVCANYSPKFAFFASKPSAIADSLILEFHSKQYWLDVISTSTTVIGGLILSILFGYGLGLSSYKLSQLGLELEPVLLALGSVPVFSLAPLIILGFGIGFSAKLVVVVISSIFLVSSGVFQGAKEVDREYGSILRDFGNSGFLIWKKIIFKGALIYAIPSIKGAVALSLIGAFVAEWISSTDGLGKYILSAMSLYQSSKVMIGIISFMMISTILMAAITIVENKTSSWRNYR